MVPAVKDLVTDYVRAVSSGDFDGLARLVHPDASFGGTVLAEARGRDTFVQGFRNLQPITVRTDLRQLVVEDGAAAVLYDFVTDTAVGSVLCAEFLEIEDQLIRSSTLVFDWRRWPEVLAEIRRRVDAATPASSS
jgi:hypothetical protein